MQYATKAQRMGSFIIDDIILGILIGLCYWISWGLGIIVGFMGATLYFGFMEGSGMHATLGKYLMGIVVVDENGQPIDMGKSFTRAICRILSGLMLGIGFIIGLFDDEGKALHDRIAGTRVITKESLGMGVGFNQYGNNMGGMNQYGNNNMGGPQPMPQKVAGGQPKLIGMSGRYAGQVFMIAPQGLVMGRDNGACDFTFDASTQGISRTHCKIQFNPQSRMFVLYDLGSSYGTFLANGTRIPQGQPMTLRPGDQFYLANQSCMFMVNI